MSEALSELGVRHLDTYEYFVEAGGDSDRFYVNRGALHLSRVGHQVVHDAFRSAGLGSPAETLDIRRR